MKRIWVITTLGALLGAALGASRVLCPDGQCQLTGSWYGGGLIGGWLAFFGAQIPTTRG